MTDKLILKTTMISKADRYNLENVAVEKVINVSDAEFKRFVEKPMERNYYLSTYKELSGFYDDSYHGVLFVNTESGDGLLVNSEGADYARYSQYIPNARALVQAHEQTAAMSEFENYIEEKIDDIISASGEKQSFTLNADNIFAESETRKLFYNAVCAALQKRPEIKDALNENGKILTEKNDLTEIRLYCPLKIEIDPGDGSAYAEEVDSANYIDYDSEINAKIREDIRDDECALERGLAAYLYDESIAEKVYSIFPKVETRNGELYGVAICISYGELDRAEMTELTDYITGQFSDGWGEGFEQHPVTLGEDEVYISFWGCDDNYFLKPESEVFPEQKMDFNMGGM